MNRNQSDRDRSTAQSVADLANPLKEQKIAIPLHVAVAAAALLGLIRLATGMLQSLLLALLIGGGFLVGGALSPQVRKFLF